MWNSWFFSKIVLSGRKKKRPWRNKHREKEFAFLKTYYVQEWCYVFYIFFLFHNTFLKSKLDFIIKRYGSDMVSERLNNSCKVRAVATSGLHIWLVTHWSCRQSLSAHCLVHCQSNRQEKQCGADWETSFSNFTSVPDTQGTVHPDQRQSETAR